MKRAIYRIGGLLAATGLAAAGAAVYGRRAVADGIAGETPMTYAGVLEEEGQRVTGQRMMRLVLWNHPSETASANRKCETLPLEKTVVTDGRFTLPLDNSCTVAVKENTDLYLELYVEGESMGRNRLGAVPYAVEAQRAAEASGALKVELAALSDTLSTKSSALSTVSSQLDQIAGTIDSLGVQSAASSARLDTVESKLAARRTITQGGKSMTIDGLYCGSSPPTSGNLGGYAAGKKVCEDACGVTTAHMCTTAELVAYAQLGGAKLATGWYASGFTQEVWDSSLGDMSTNDCDGYRSNNHNFRGPVWQDRSLHLACDAQKPVLCCN